MNKSTPLSVAIISSILILGSDASAKERVKKHVIQEPYVTSSQSSPEMHSSSMGRLRFGLGFTTSDLAPSIAALIEFTELAQLQFNFVITGTSPFGILVGPTFRYTLVEKGGAGFHVGAGGLFGALDGTFATARGLVGGGAGKSFAMQLAALAGFHFEIPGASQVKVIFEGGPNFTLFGGNFTTFATSPSSSTLGMTVAYLF